MGRTYINDAEDAALRGLSLAARVLYQNGLRKHVDFKTGVVGRTRRISYQMFYELLEVRPPPRSRREFWQPKKDDVRQLFVELTRSRLIERLRDTGVIAESLVFFLPLADSDLKGFFPPPHMRPTAPTHGGAQHLCGFQGGVAHSENRKSSTPPISDNLSSSSLLNNNSAGRFAMYADWLPDRYKIDEHCGLLGVPKEFIDLGVIDEFASYWMTEPEEQLTEDGWVRKMIVNRKFNLVRVPNTLESVN